MILDTTLMFSDAQVLTGAAVSTNVVDTGAPQTPPGGAAALDSDLGKGTPKPILIQVISALTGTMTATVQTSDATSFSPTKKLGIATFELNAPAGTQATMLYVPQGAKRYIRINYSGITGGTVTAGISLGNQTNGNIT